MRAIVLAFVVASAGCYSSYQAWSDGDWEVRDRVEVPDVRDDAESGEDAGGDADADADADLPAEADAEADADADGDGDADGDADVLVEECPDSLPTGGLVRLTLRWRRLAATDWTDAGSAALGEASNVVLAAFPRPSSPTGEPRLVRLSADSGEPLLDGPPLIPEYAFDTALAFADPWLVGASPLEGSGFTVGLRLARLQASGTISGDVSWHPLELDGSWVSDLRASARHDRLYAAAGGRDASGRVLHAMTLPLTTGTRDVWVMYESRTEPAAGFVAWAEGDEGGRVAWAQPDRLELRMLEGTNLAAVDLPQRSAFIPVAAAQQTAPGAYDFVFAGRTEDAGAGGRMWIEARNNMDLGFHSGAYLDHLESLVRRPEPRALERVGEQLVLAWAAQRSLGGGEPVASCLYLTPLDASGEPNGGTLRVDPGIGEAHLPGIEHVRLVVGPDGIFLLWRQDPELWVARVDGSS